MRVPALPSTAVRFTCALGHKLDRTSRATCCEARADNRATEICGLCFSASACASLIESTGEFGELVGPDVGCDAVWRRAYPLRDDFCGIGLEGKFDRPTASVSWAAMQADNARTVPMVTRGLVLRIFSWCRLGFRFMLASPGPGRVDS